MPLGIFLQGACPLRRDEGASSTADAVPLPQRGRFASKKGMCLKYLYIYKLALLWYDAVERTWKE
jgi:hypothetical protein